MFFHRDIKGAGLPPKTLCLTYDDGPGETPGDGPGPHTSALGRYLFHEGIRAIFFVIGRHAEENLPTLARLRDWGHLIGNHTYSHPGLVALAEAGGNVVGELDRTQEIIRGFQSSDAVFFRAPYGNWRQKQRPDSAHEMPTSVVADLLNAQDRLSDHVGPVNWDIVAEDWECWRRGVTAAECARRYAAEIDRKGSGIVLMHDSSEQADLRRCNLTLQLTMSLVPELKAKGYRFVALDEVPLVVSGLSSIRKGDRASYPPQRFSAL